MLRQLLRQVMISASVLTAFFAVVPFAQAHATRACFQVFQADGQFEAQVVATRNATKIKIQMSKIEPALVIKILPRGWPFHAPLIMNATLHLETGVLSFEVRTRTTNGHLLYPKIQAQALFHLMMEALGDHPVHAIEAQWFLNYHKDDLGGFLINPFVTNTNQYLEGLANGEERALAARHTWTGRLAGLYGFNHVESIEKKDLYAGEFIVVKFVRP